MCIYVPNLGAPSFINTKRHEKSDLTRYNTIFWLSFSPLDRSSKLKSGKDLNYITNQLDLTDLQNIS